MSSWLCASHQSNQINPSDLTTKIETLDSTTSDLITQAIVIQCECEFDSAGECICDTLPLDHLKRLGQVKCLDFAKITKELTGGIISNKSLRDMYDYISYMLGDEDTFDFPSEWNFSNENRYVLLKNSLSGTDKDTNIRGFCFYPDELSYIKPLIVIYLSERKPTIVF
ncbi:hypothetical protein H012_gp001 [Acanthamoeba polyphaga moumouvirus]|uniref:Uncharacterized protein n=1 Tax=Acanthamoeba polyphaga moumouvirus TaxID=1269028 RepID=L7RFH6_9VIRU|nr:hypothetical protein H012_gp001 [Acanthamoeba polyphaga moumouvirus]AGC01550.1 hypothetical protein Moumou_00001 [Acanthamoeba polyphaga moumouvirus]